MTTTTAEEREEILRIAKAVLAGDDAIDVPTMLVVEHEPPKGAPAPTPAAEEPFVEPTNDHPTLSLYMQIRGMTVPQRVKLAMKGNREARGILLRDTNRMIQRMVLVNPRITEDEIMIIAKDRNAEVEILRQIGDSRDWVGHYGIRAALVENARTPISIALRLLKTLQEREIKALAKSKNVPSAVSGQARRMLFRKQDAARGGSGH